MNHQRTIQISLGRPEKVSACFLKRLQEVSLSARVLLPLRAVALTYFILWTLSATHGMEHRAQMPSESNRLSIRQAGFIGSTDPIISTGKAVETGNMTNREVEQSRTSMGVIFCPQTPKRKAARGTGVVVIKKDTLITAAHLFTNDNGSLKDDLLGCFFVNAEHTTQKHFLDLHRGSFVNGLEGGSYLMGKDFAIVSVHPPISEAIPYTLDTSGLSVLNGTSLIMIMNQYDSNRRFYSRATTFQVCKKQENFKDDKSGFAAFLDDCSTFRGDSGAPMFISSAQGLVLKGLNVGQASPTADHCVYNEKTCAGIAVEIRGPFLQELLKR